MKNLIQIIFTILTISLPLLAMSGSVPGPLVIIVDLSKEKDLTRLIENPSNSKALECRRPDVQLFINRRPAGLTDKLVISGTIRKNKAAIYKLNKVLHMADDDIDKGYDGIVIYSKNPKPKFITFVSGYSATLETPVLHQGDDAEFIKTLCMVLPPITRKP